jgi:hypothetical protein
LAGSDIRASPPSVGGRSEHIKLYQDAEFVEALATHAAEIGGYADGAGRYAGSQYEVVLKVESLDTATVLAMGGYSSDSRTLAGIMAQRDPTPEDISWFEHYRKKAGVELGATWLEGAPWERVLSRLEPRILQLKEIKKVQQAARKA